MDRDSLAFCIGALVASLIVAWVAFPFAAMDMAVIEAAAKPQPSYEMGSVNVGEGFGEVPVEELMVYYIENPPSPESNAVAAPEVRFGGC